MRSFVRVHPAAGSLSPLLRLGLLVFLLGACADLAFHLLAAPAGGALAALLGPDGSRAHLVTLVGMVVVLLGVLERGVRHAR